MKKLKLMAVQSQKEDILKDLMLLGCVQIDQPQDAQESEDDAARLKRRGVLMEYNSKRTTINNALDRLKKYAPYSKGLLTPLPEAGVDEILDESSLEEDLRIAQIEGSNVKVGGKWCPQLWSNTDKPARTLFYVHDDALQGHQNQQAAFNMMRKALAWLLHE